jgi:hypothetical protein
MRLIGGNPFCCPEDETFKKPYKYKKKYLQSKIFYAILTKLFQRKHKNRRRDCQSCTKIIVR